MIELGLQQINRWERVPVQTSRFQIIYVSEMCQISMNTDFSDTFLIKLSC